MNRETLRMQMLAGVITESQYKTRLAKLILKENEGNENGDIISKLKDNNIEVNIDDGLIYLIGDSGEYVGNLDNGEVSFSLINDEEEFDDYNWEDILGPNHVFVKLYNIVGGDIEAIDDYVMITVDANKLIPQNNN